MSSNLAVLAIATLIIVVALGFWKQVNIGVLAIGSSLVLGLICGMTSKEILAGFDAQLFATLVGVTFLFSIAQVNGTLELLANKAVAMVGDKAFLVPIVIFFVSGILSAIGPGNIPIGALMTVVAVTVAVGMKQNPILYALLAKLAANAFAITPLTPAGIIAIDLGAKVSVFGFEIPLMLNVMLWGLILAVAFCIVYRLDKVKTDVHLKREEIDKFNKNQVITLIGMAIMVIMVAGFNQNVGLASFLVASVLLMFKVAEQKKAFAAVPWGTLILICGVGVLMNIVGAVGGTDLLSNALLSIMNEHTVRPVLAGASGLLSFFSSTTGVVMPTLIPTVPGIVESFNGAFSFTELTSIIISSSFSAAFSPASTGGGLILAAYMSASGAGEAEQNKLFGQLLMIAVGCVVFNILLSFLGVYGIIG